MFAVSGFSKPNWIFPTSQHLRGYVQVAPTAQPSIFIVILSSALVGVNHSKTELSRPLTTLGRYSMLKLYK
jgi:hypothetical protein